MEAAANTLGPVLIGIAGTSLTTAERQLLCLPAVGGVVLFSRNIESADQVAVLCSEIRGLRQPRLLITIDQEGGRVQRLREGFTALPPLRRIGEIYSSDPDKACDLAYRHARVMATEVLDLGIDMSFAPVLDLDCGSSVIANRSLGVKPDQVIALAGAYIAGMRDSGMQACGKHFPGHGSVELDSHFDDVVDERSRTQILEQDLRPFVDLGEQLSSIMVAHVSYPAVAAEPAGYSKYWLKDILRQQYVYKGVVISDDLDMFAACSVGAMSTRVELALISGCDLVLICDNNSAVQYLADKPYDLGDVASVIKSLYGQPTVSREDALMVPEFRHWVSTLESLGA